MKHLRSAIMGLLALALLPMAALAQTAPSWPQGFVPTPSQWASVFAAKQDYLGTSGSGALARVASPVFTAPNLGVPSSVDLANAINVPVAKAIGILGAAHGGTSCSAASGTCLDNIAGFAGTGFLSRTGAGTYSFTLSSGSGQVCLTTSCAMVTPSMASPTWTGTAAGAALNLSGNLTLSSGLSAGGGLGISGQVLQSTGGGVQWATAGSGTVTSVQISGGTTGLVASGGPITGAGTVTLSGVVSSSSGGAGSISGALKANGSGIVSQAAAADLSNGTTGTGSVVLSASPTITGTMTAATLDAQTQLKGKGTATNDNAATGYIGEYICAKVTNGGSPSGCSTNSASPVAFASTATVTVTSISLTSGDWEVCGNIFLNPVGAGFTSITAGISNAAAAQPSNADLDGALTILNATFSGSGQVLPTGCKRFTTASTASQYLVASGNTTGSGTAWGIIWARRIR